MDWKYISFQSSFDTDLQLNFKPLVNGRPITLGVCTLFHQRLFTFQFYMTKHQINKYSFLIFFLFCSTLQVQGLISAVSNDAENVHEEVDDVQVELDGGQDVLLGAESGHDHLRVHDDEQREEEGPAHRQRRVRQLVAEEDLQEAAEDEDHEPGAQDRVQVGEVTLGLEQSCQQTFAKFYSIYN